MSEKGNMTPYFDSSVIKPLKAYYRDHDFTESEVFIRGFRLGMMIAVEVLNNGDKAIPDLE